MNWLGWRRRRLRNVWRRRWLWPIYRFGEFRRDLLVDYDADEVSRLIVDELDQAAFSDFAHLTVGEFRDWLLGEQATPEALSALAPGLMPEMVAAVSKIMRVQDLITVAAKIRVVSRFRTTVGLPGRLSTRLQPNHPTDDPAGIAASILDGLSLESGDAMIGINPVSDSWLRRWLRCCG